MAHLWLPADDGWSPSPLPLTNGGVRPPGAADALLVSVGGDEREWALITRASTAVTINGCRMAGGLHLLRDRDEIRLGLGQPWFFSTETLAVVDVAPPSDVARKCPRCKQDIAAGSKAVRCPGCDVWYHQSAKLPCWTYAETCALCEQPTQFEAGYRFTPEAL